MFYFSILLFTFGSCCLFWPCCYFCCRSVSLSRFLAIWVTLAAVWKIIWHLYSRLIGIFYETRACWKVQQQQQHGQQHNSKHKQTFVLFSRLLMRFLPVSDNDTGTQNQRSKINLMSKTCNKLHSQTNEFYLFHFPSFSTNWVTYVCFKGICCCSTFVFLDFCIFDLVSFSNRSDQEMTGPAAKQISVLIIWILLIRYWSNLFYFASILIVVPMMFLNFFYFGKWQNEFPQ